MSAGTEPIAWLRDWDAAFTEARRVNKPVLVVAKEPSGCLGCAQLEAYTLSDPAVQAAISERFVPLRVYPREPAMRALRVLWFPTTLVFDKRGIEHYRAINPLPPGDYLDLLAIGESLARMRSAEYAAAIDLLQAARDRSPDSVLAPEILFYLGIAWYFRERRQTGMRDRIWSELTGRFPESPWAYRVPWHLDAAMGQPGRAWDLTIP
jgi:hypothetical protein